MSRLLTALGHEVIVGHAQKVRLITKNRRKDDRLDAWTLARLARIDPELLSPVQHRSAQAQLHLAEIRARAGLVSARTALVNAARGLVKSYGERLHKCGTQQFTREITNGLSTELREALRPLLREVESLNEGIREYDRRIEKMAKETYPETALLKQVKGVGDLIATVHVLTIEDPHRFRKSRDAGCFASGNRKCSSQYSSGRIETASNYRDRGAGLPRSDHPQYTESHGRLANANKAAAPRTGARRSGADAQKLHHTRRIAAAER